MKTPVYSILALSPTKVVVSCVLPQTHGDVCCQTDLK